MERLEIFRHLIKQKIMLGLMMKEDDADDPADDADHEANDADDSDLAAHADVS